MALRDGSLSSDATRAADWHQRARRRDGATPPILGHAPREDGRPMRAGPHTRSPPAPRHRLRLPIVSVESNPATTPRPHPSTMFLASLCASLPRPSLAPASPQPRAPACCHPSWQSCTRPPSSGSDWFSLARSCLHAAYTLLTHCLHTAYTLLTRCSHAAHICVLTSVRQRADLRRDRARPAGPFQDAADRLDWRRPRSEQERRQRGYQREQWGCRQQGY